MVVVKDLLGRVFPFLLGVVALIRAICAVEIV
jgi:hypothetical protein